MMLWWLIPIALIVWLLVRPRQNDSNRSAPTPLVILDERYARGEIDRDEYQSRRADLQHAGANREAGK